MSYSLTSSNNDCYENTSVLINKLDIRDEDQLKQIESVISLSKIMLIENENYRGDFDLIHLCDIHRFIFDELYDWAGHLKTINISKKGTNFCDVKELENNANLFFKYLKKNNYFADLPKQKYCNQIAEIYSDLNMLHPFREGNGRAQRVFISQMVKSAGYSIDFKETDNDFLMIATIYAAQGVSDYLQEFFRNNIL